ncbi:nodulin-related protein 1 [Melia azedarach]|uniref:Nodulin-related protein 1 n=1 Tax=Melia azedarach TaxID=155640 RepID=A0ACC1XJE6_MELAZ|nr:nodulin-related protein 1 [Melia azedarach]
MDLLLNHLNKPTKHSDGKPDKHHSEIKPAKNDQPSKAELLSSAKLVADAAKSTLNHDSKKVDKTKVAHAAGDLLNAASHYGKLDEKRHGKHVGKAESYLHNYNSQPPKTSNHHSESLHWGAAAKPAATKPSSHSGSGYADYLKKAEDFLKKH